jgi:hypothetical protein
MKKHERDRLEARLKKMLHNLVRVEEWKKEREAKEKRTMAGSMAGNMIRRRKGKKDKRLTAKVRKSSGLS